MSATGNKNEPLKSTQLGQRFRTIHQTTRHQKIPTDIFHANSFRVTAVSLLSQRFCADIRQHSPEGDTGASH